MTLNIFRYFKAIFTGIASWFRKGAENIESNPGIIEERLKQALTTKATEITATVARVGEAQGKIKQLGLRIKQLEKQAADQQQMLDGIDAIRDKQTDAIIARMKGKSAEEIQAACESDPEITELDAPYTNAETTLAQMNQTLEVLRAQFNDAKGFVDAGIRHAQDMKTQLDRMQAEAPTLVLRAELANSFNALRDQLGGLIQPTSNRADTVFAQVRDNVAMQEGKQEVSGIVAGEGSKKLEDKIRNAARKSVQSSAFAAKIAAKVAAAAPAEKAAASPVADAAGSGHVNLPGGSAQA